MLFAILFTIIFILVYIAIGLYVVINDGQSWFKEVDAETARDILSWPVTLFTRFKK